MAEPEEGPRPVDTVGALLANALVDAGVAGIDEDIEQPVLNRALFQLNGMIATMSRKRWLAYRLVDYAFTTTGAQTYLVGLNQTVNINPRPDRLEYAFLRFLNQASPPAFPVDIPVDIIQSREDYARIPVKNIGTIAWRIFYDPAIPNGVLYPWPVPQASIYELHVGFKVTIPRFTSLNQPINLPIEYEIYFNWGLARRLRASYQMPADPTIDSLARDALNAIRLANSAIGTLRLPRALRGRGTGRAYDYRGDSDSFM